MQIHILAIGKETPNELRELQSDYERRLQPHAKITWKLLPSSKFAEPDRIRVDESNAIREQCKSTDTIILLDERGTEQNNEQFAKTFEQLAGNHGRILIIIGGAYGVDETLRSQVRFVWSFSKLVFPHQLVRVMLLEQLYRTFMVLNNHPYHHI